MGNGVGLTISEKVFLLVHLELTDLYQTFLGGVYEALQGQEDRFVLKLVSQVLVTETRNEHLGVGQVVLYLHSSLHQVEPHSEGDGLLGAVDLAHVPVVTIGLEVEQVLGGDVEGLAEVPVVDSVKEVPLGAIEKYEENQPLKVHRLLL